MKRLSAVILFCFVAALSASAEKKLNQKPRDVEWADNPVLHPVPPEYAREPAIVLRQDVSYDYKYEGRHLVAYFTFHRIVKVLDEKGIVSFNTEGFSVDGRTRVPLIKARTILPGGKVMDIAKNMIKVTRDDGGHYKIVIAMEGIEKNAEVELLVKEIRPGYAFGSEIFQMPIPILSAHFRMSYPKELLFEEKGYNGFPNVRDTLINTRRHMEVAVSDIPALLPEPNSFYNVNCMRVEYRLRDYRDPNDYDTLRRLNTWDEMAQGIFNEYYKLTDSERSAVNRYLSALGVRAGADEMESIKKIEKGIKSNIVLYPYIDDAHADMLDSVIAKKAATPNGYIKLFAACFSQALVKHEIGKVGDRSDIRFDSKFENWDNLGYYLFYFPDLKKYLAPTSIYYRCPVVPCQLTSGKGIFCRIPAKAPASGPWMKVRTVNALGPAENRQDIAALVTLNNDMDAQVDISYSYYGYSAGAIRQNLLQEVKENEKDVVDKIITVADKPRDIVKYSVSNEGVDNYYGNTPLEITATLNANHLVEKAGKQYLLKIGEITGTHEALYADKKRAMPVDLPYPMQYTRTITVNIPRGYKVVNPEATRMESEFVDGNLVALASFKSDYTIVSDKKNGDKLVVTVTERYPKIHFPVADYERFREVVNTGADFKKVALLLVKKGQI